MWQWLKSCFRPAAVETERPAAGSLEGRYVRSFLFLRLMIGFLGFALPFALVFLDDALFHGDPFPRASMSDYYYSNMREVFTVTLGTIAFFLFAYKITERNLDNTLSVVAGFAGMAIPLFPTSRPHDVASFPSFAALFGEQWSTRIHYGASAVFITALGCVCILFGRREAERAELRDDRGARRLWPVLHYTCAGTIAVAGIWILVTSFVVDGAPYWSLLAGEWAMVAAFGTSWFAKGAEIRYLLGRGGTDRPYDAPASAAS